MELLSNILNMVCWYLRPLIKWFLRQTTRLCELQRVCYGEPAGAARTLGVEISMTQSRNKDITDLLKSMDSSVSKFNTENSLKSLFESSCNQIMRTKDIKPDLHRQFVQSIQVCLRQIWGYKKLKVEVESLRAESFDSDNLSHEQDLVALWALLQPDKPLVTRVTKQWQDIGFQGEDPKTDFRGMGILSLFNLLYFCREFGSTAKHILSHSHHPKYGYSFAIVGINLTHMAFKLLQDDSLKTHIYNVTLGCANLDNFHHFFSYLFVEFDKFWLECKPKDIMEFNRIRDLFESNIRAKLGDRATCFSVNIEVDTV